MLRKTVGVTITLVIVLLSVVSAFSAQAKDEPQSSPPPSVTIQQPQYHPISEPSDTVTLTTNEYTTLRDGFIQDESWLKILSVTLVVVLIGFGALFSFVVRFWILHSRPRYLRNK